MLAPMRPASGSMAAAAGMAAGDAVPLLVRLLAGNPVTTAAVFDCLNTADARHARRLHPAIASVAEAVPWCDMDTPVVNVVRWRTGLPGAVGATLAPSAVQDLLTSEPAAAALSGITHLDMRACMFVTDKLLLRLPTTLRTLNVGKCRNLTGAASFAHLTALVSLDCSGTLVVSKRTDRLPPSLQELDIGRPPARLPDVSLAHLRQLRLLRASGGGVGATALASLPQSVEELHVSGFLGFLPSVFEASFAHLTALRQLDVSFSIFDDGLLATLPSCLVVLHAHGCMNLTPDAVLPHLPALQLLDISGTAIGDTLVASLPASLIELRLAGCSNVTPGATLDHLRALRILHCIDTELAPTALAACHKSGCAVPAARQLHGHTNTVSSLAVLGDGRLASGDKGGAVLLWDLATGGESTAVLRTDNPVRVLAALPDSHRLAIGTSSMGDVPGNIQVWDVGGVSPTRCATIGCPSAVDALVVLADGRLAAGCQDGAVRVVDVNTGAVAATLTGHTNRVAALAVLPGGALASASTDTTVRVWDVGARVCVATLTGHTTPVTRLAVLADGRLASKADYDGAVRLWDVRTRACVGMLSTDTSMPAGRVTVLAGLPDGRLATGSESGTIRLWGMRLAAAGTGGAEVAGVVYGWVEALLSLPAGRLACITGTQTVYLLEVPPPAADE